MTFPRLALLVLAAAMAAPLARAESEAPADPAAAPPAPVRLGEQPLREETRPRPYPPIAQVPGVQTLTSGGWRLSGPAAQFPPHGGIQSVLAEIGRLLAERPQGRVTVLAQVAGPADDDSLARRASLARGQAIRQGLEQGGLSGTRIDIRPLGRTAESADAVTILPPGAPQPVILR